MLHARSQEPAGPAAPTPRWRRWFSRAHWAGRGKYTTHALVALTDLAIIALCAAAVPARESKDHLAIALIALGSAACVGAVLLAFLIRMPVGLLVVGFVTVAMSATWNGTYHEDARNAGFDAASGQNVGAQVSWWVMLAVTGMSALTDLNVRWSRFLAWRRAQRLLQRKKSGAKAEA